MSHVFALMIETLSMLLSLGISSSITELDSDMAQSRVTPVTVSLLPFSLDEHTAFLNIVPCSFPFRRIV